MSIQGFLSCLVVLLLSVPAQAAITIGDTSANNTGTGDATTLNVTHVGDACANDVAVCGLATQRGTGASAVPTYGGTNMTAAIENYDSINPIGGCGLYYLVNPTQGSVTVAFSFALSHAVGACITLCGVNQSAPLADTDTTEGNATNTSLTLTSTTTDLVVDMLQRRQNDNEPTVGANQTERAEDVTSDATAANNTWGKISTEPGGVSSTTMSWSWPASLLMHQCASVFAAATGRRGHVLFFD